MKSFCPNCERETECEHTAELFWCSECDEDFAKYIVSRKPAESDGSVMTLLSKEPDFDNMPIEQINQYLREYGYDPEQVGARGKILADTLMKNIELRAQLEACESALISMVQQFFYSAEGSNIYSHAFMSAEEEAAAYLVGFGLAHWNDVHHSQIVFPEVKE